MIVSAGDPTSGDTPKSKIIHDYLTALTSNPGVGILSHFCATRRLNGATGTSEMNSSTCKESPTFKILKIHQAVVEIQ